VWQLQKFHIKPVKLSSDFSSLFREITDKRYVSKHFIRRIAVDILIEIRQLALCKELSARYIPASAGLRYRRHQVWNLRYSLLLAAGTAGMYGCQYGQQARSVCYIIYSL
jgi:hypothetical protein